MDQQLSGGSSSNLFVNRKSLKSTKVDKTFISPVLFYKIRQLSSDVLFYEELLDCLAENDFRNHLSLPLLLFVWNFKEF